MSEKRSFRVCPLASGSTGNVTLISSTTGSFLVDAGLSMREILARIDAVGVDPATLAGVVVTHGHVDHCRSAAALSRKFRIPIWGTRPTLASLPARRDGDNLYAIPDSGKILLAGMVIETLGVAHDAAGTVITRINRRVGIATDLGRVDSAVRAFLDGLEGLILEFNHDEQMLETGPYYPFLKARIRSDQGHLSNAQAAALLLDPAFTPPSQVLWLAHLSQENNTPRLALETAKSAFGAVRPVIHVAGPDEPSPAAIFA